MTTLAFDGTTLAADRLMLAGGMKQRCRKIHVMPKWIYAGAKLPPRPAPDVTAKMNPDGSVTITMPATAETLARLAASLYAEGQSHEEVTAYLESKAPRFRELLAEIHGTVDGKPAVRWMAKPASIYMRMTFEDE